VTTISPPGAAAEQPRPRVLLVDNYDSFTYNLAHLLCEAGAEVDVRRHDAVDEEEAEAADPTHLVISPGPGRPSEAGVSGALVRRFAGRIPVLGVCLGHQCIGHVFGGEVVRAPQVMHGKTSPIDHSGRGVFAGLPSPLTATRYHSLVLDPASIPDCLEVTARTADDVVMGIRHRELPVEGVQFHPESILTGCGHDLLRNFLASIPRSAGAKPR
jgi:anthranilate synthase/aminodeoxychorismate synthase-like glutamine amidotransferase